MHKCERGEKGKRGENGPRGQRSKVRVEENGRVVEDENGLAMARGRRNTIELDEHVATRQVVSKWDSNGNKSIY